MTEPKQQFPAEPKPKDFPSEVAELVRPDDYGHLARGGDPVAEAERVGKIVNNESDKDYHPVVAPPVTGRDLDAEGMSPVRGGIAGLGASRVGHQAVSHPHAGTARVMNDALGERDDATAERVGASTTETDFVQPMTDAERP